MFLLALACTADPIDSAAPELATSYTLSDAVDFPEGLAWHPEQRAFYVSSLGHGGLTRVDLDGGEVRVFQPEGEGWTSLGGKVGEEGSVYFCGVQNPSTEQASAELWIHDPNSEDTTRVPLQGVANCNDLAIDGRQVFLSDRESARMHRVDLDTLQSEIFLEDPLLEPGLIGNNGLVRTTDGALILGQYSPPKLIRIPIEDREALAEIPLDGDEIGSLPDGADGIAWFGEELVIAANKRVAVVGSSDDWQSGTVRARDLEVGIAAVTVAEGQVYGLKGEVVPWVLGLEPELPFQILAVELPE